MNIVSSSCLALLMLQGMGSLEDGTPDQASCIQVVANYGTKDIRINRNVLGWNIGKDSPTGARIKGRQLGIHFRRFSEVGAREDPFEAYVLLSIVC